MNLRTQIQTRLSTTVAFIGNTDRRAFDAVIFELADGTGQVARTLVVETSGTLHRDLDTKRVQRTARRLRALGFRKTWDAFRHPQDGVGGTVRMFKA